MVSNSSMVTGPLSTQVATFGGRPTQSPDIAVSALFIAFYGTLGALNWFIFRRNKAVGHFFFFSELMFAFCMSRVTTFIIRIETARNPTSVTLAIVASVLVSSGVILLLVTNMNFAQRLVRAFYPRFYGSKPFQYSFLAYYLSLIVVLAMVIATTVQSFLTHNQSTLKTDLAIRRFGSVWFLIFTFAPIPIVLIAKLTATEPQNFGKKGNLQTKAIIVMVAAAILTLSTGVRAASTLVPTRPANDPAWFQGRAAFYIFLPTLEVCVVVLFLATRVDQLFFIPGKAELEREATPEKILSLTPEGYANPV